MTETLLRTTSSWCKWIDLLRMRMIRRRNGPLGPGQLPRRLNWGGHMAPHGAINKAINVLLRWALTPPRRHPLRLGLCIRLQMDASSRSPDHFGSVNRALLPLRSLCPGGCATPCERTATGHRCSLHCCLETIPGFHYTHSNFCPSNFNFQVSPVIVGQFSPGLAAPSSASSAHSEKLTMPRLRQRMTCRRGSSRGRSMSERPPYSSSDDSSSEPPDRRSALARFGTPGHIHGSHTPAPPQSSPPLHASADPPLPGSHILRQSSQRAELRFDSAFNRPTITAFITVTLREEATIHPPPTSGPAPTPFVPTLNPTASPSAGPSVPLASAPSSTDHILVQVGTDLFGEDGAKTVEAEPEDPYGCRIEEEQSVPK